MAIPVAANTPAVPKASFAPIVFQSMRWISPESRATSRVSKESSPNPEIVISTTDSDRAKLKSPKPPCPSARAIAT